MDLVVKLKQEIEKLQLQNSLEIAYFLYIRTGEIFEYDPRWEVASDKEAKQIFEKKIDIHNISSFKIVCSSWAYLYADLLQEFNIPAEVIGKRHLKVKFWIEKEEYIADITDHYEDIWRIKFGCPVKHFYSKKRMSFENADLNKKIKYDKGIQIKEVIQMIKRELLQLKMGEYSYKVCQIIENIMSFPRENVEYISGRECIDYIFKQFENPLEYARFFDKENQIYFSVYQIFDFNGEVHYFAYQRMLNGFYEFHEVSQSTLCTYLNTYKVIDEENIGIVKI